MADVLLDLGRSFLGWVSTPFESAPPDENPGLVEEVEPPLRRVEVDREVPSKRWTAQPHAGLGVGEDGEQPWLGEDAHPFDAPEFDIP